MKALRRICDFFIIIFAAGTLYSGCLTPAEAQNVTCATRPAGDNSNACASTAFVSQNTIFIPVCAAGGAPVSTGTAWQCSTSTANPLTINPTPTSTVQGLLINQS